jgi:hypothetical protein
MISQFVTNVKRRIKMDESQNVSIKLSEYLELKELETHKKLVKFTIIHKYSCGEDKWEGSGVEWISDWKCWKKLADKLDKQGRRFKELFKENEKFKDMTVAEFKKYKQEKS